MKIGLHKTICEAISTKLTGEANESQVLLSKLDFNLGAIEISNSLEMTTLLLILDELFETEAESRDRFRRAVATRVDKLITTIKAMAIGTEFEQGVVEFNEIRETK